MGDVTLVGAVLSSAQLNDWDIGL